MLLQFFYFRAEKCNILVTINTFFQVLIALGALWAVSLGKYVNGELYLYPFIILAILNFITNYMLNAKIKIRIDIINANKVIKILAILFAILGVYYIISHFSGVVELYTSGEYLLRYLDVHDEDYAFYDNLFDKIVLNFLDYLYVIVLFYGFVQLASNKVRNGLMLIVIITFYRLLLSIETSSRTDMFSLAMLLITFYFLFRSFFSNKIKKAFKSIGLLALGFIGFFAILVTSSRFEDKTLADWIFDYLGFSVLDFHDVVCSTVRFRDGSYFFKWLRPFFPGLNQTALYTRDFGSGFIPAFGQLYLDFAWWWLLVYIPLITFINRYVSIKKSSLPSLYLLLFMFVYVFIGNLYCKNDFISIAMCFLIFTLLRFGNKRIVNKKSKIYKLNYQ